MNSPPAPGCEAVRGRGGKGGRGEGGWGEFESGTLNSKPLVYFPHELTPGPWLRSSEGERGEGGKRRGGMGGI